MFTLILIISLSLSSKVAEYKFGINFGQIIYDYSGNGRHGSNLHFKSTDRGVYFDGSANSITLNNPRLPKTCSIIFWFLANGQSGSIFYFGNDFEQFNEFQSESQALVMKWSLILDPSNIRTNNLGIDSLNIREWSLVMITRKPVSCSLIYCSENEYTIKNYFGATLTVKFPKPLEFTDPFFGLGAKAPTLSLKGFLWYFIITDAIENINSFYSSTATEICAIGSCLNCIRKVLDPTYGAICLSTSKDITKNKENLSCSASASCSLSFEYLCTCTSNSCLFSLSASTYNCIETSGTIISSALTPNPSCLSPYVPRSNKCCSTYCLDCTLSDYCAICTDPNAIPNIGKCTCKPGYFGTPSNSNISGCTKCGFGCSECSSFANCANCYDTNASPSSGFCVCKSGFAGTPASDTGVAGCIVPCIPNCGACSGTACDSCADPNAELNAFGCACKPGFVGSPSSSSTLPGCINQCDQKCSSCDNSGMCAGCYDINAEPYQTSCICKNGYSGDPSLSLASSGCVLDIKCSDQCLSCDSNGLCKSCRDPNAEVDKNNNCVCKFGFLGNPINNGLTSGCSEVCDKECSKCNVSECFECFDENAIINNGKCVCKLDYTGTPSKGIGVSGCVLECPQLCNKCEDYQLCKFCLTLNAYPVNETCVCQPGFYVNHPITPDNPCKKCNPECKTCDESGACLICISANASPTENYGCKCNEGYYNTSLLFKKDSCHQCERQCLICESESYCLNCKGKNSYLLNGSCFCEPGFYLPDDSTIDCLPCNKDVSAVCNITCEINQIFYQGNCVNCSKNCDSCDQDLRCTECSNKEPPVNGACDCPKGLKIVKGKCERKTFELILESYANNEITLNFNEIPEKVLKNSMILIKNNKKLINFKIYIVDSQIYRIELQEKLTKTILNITIKENPFYSLKGSELKQYSYSLEFYALNTSEFNKKVSKAISSAASAAFTSTLFSNPASCWILLNTIQLISYFPLCSIDFSQEMIDFFQGIGNYNIIPEVFKSFLSETSSEAPNDKCKRVGITTTVFWINFGKNVIPLLGYICLIPLLIIGLIFKSLRAKCIKLLKNYRYSLFIRFLIQTYLDVLLFSILQIQSVFYI